MAREGPRDRPVGAVCVFVCVCVCVCVCVWEMRRGTPGRRPPKARLDAPPATWRAREGGSSRGEGRRRRSSCAAGSCAPPRPSSRAPARPGAHGRPKPGRRPRPCADCRGVPGYCGASFPLRTERPLRLSGARLCVRIRSDRPRFSVAGLKSQRTSSARSK